LLTDTGVAILPGSSFGRPANELTARIACVDFDGAKALTGAEQISTEVELDEVFLRQHCEKVLVAVEKCVTGQQLTSFETQSCRCA